MEEEECRGGIKGRRWVEGRRTGRETERRQRTVERTRGHRGNFMWFDLCVTCVLKNVHVLRNISLFCYFAKCFTLLVSRKTGMRNEQNVSRNVLYYAVKQAKNFVKQPLVSLFCDKAILYYVINPNLT